MTPHRGRNILIAASVFLTAACFWKIILQRPNDEPAASGTQPTSASPLSNRQKAAPVLQSLHLSEPQVLRIPSLQIEAPVRSVGLNKTGEMQAPENPSDVTWYKHGYLPGSRGNAVIAGHKDHKGSRAVFYNLDRLSAGDTVEVHNASHVQTFVVRDLKTYSANMLEPSIFGADNEAKLNLITCDGAWDTKTKRYPDRLVVSMAFVKETARNL